MLYRCWTKATRRETGEPRYSANWLVARRAWLEIHPDRIACGNWSIPVAEVRAATLYKARQLFIPVSVLELRTDADTFQFGLNPWVNIAPHLPFIATVQPARLRFSVFSALARFILIGALLWLAWRHLS